jgi:hypothetical protein
MLSTVLPTLQDRHEHSIDAISLFSDIADSNLRILHQKLAELLSRNTTLLQHRAPPHLIRNIHPNIPLQPITIPAQFRHTTREFLALALDADLSLDLNQNASRYMSSTVKSYPLVAEAM